MPDPLIVTDEDPVNLDGALDSANELQIKHDTGDLKDYGQSLEAEHEDLHNQGATIRVKIADFSSGGDDWEISATHDASGTTTTWSRGNDHAYCDFSEMTDALVVDVVARSNGSSSVTKTRRIWIKTKSVDGQ